jgi:translation initiation factor 1 (eIF-1/SUI1)
VFWKRRKGKVAKFTVHEIPKIEKRAKGKKVTLVEVKGDVECALLTLKGLLGVGGSKKSYNTIELQGDQVNRVIQELSNMNCYLVKTEEKPKPQVSPSTVASKYLKKTKNFLSDKTFTEALATPFIAPVSCEKLHGKYWPYCVGTCVDVDLSDVFPAIREFSSMSGDTETVKVAVEPEKVVKALTSAELNRIIEESGLSAKIGDAVFSNPVVIEEPEVIIRKPMVSRGRWPKPQPMIVSSREEASPSLPAYAWKKPVELYSLKVVLPEDTNFSDFKELVYASCEGVEKIERWGSDIKVLFKSKRNFVKAEELIGILDPQKVEEFDDTLLSEEQWDTVRLLDLENDEEFWCRFYSLIESCWELDDAFAEAVSVDQKEDMEFPVASSIEEEKSIESVQDYEPPFLLWRTVSAAQLNILQELNLDSSLKFWESLEMLVKEGADSNTAFQTAIEWSL